MVRKQLEQLLGTDSNTDGEGGGSSHRRMIKRESKKLEGFSDSHSESPSKQSNKPNSLSNFMSNSPSEAADDLRSNKSTVKTITSSSTATTKKQSNKSSNPRYSVNDLVQNSAWAGKFTESAVRRPARISRSRTDGALQNSNSNISMGNRFHQQPLNHHWINSTKGPELPHDNADISRSSSPKSDRPTKSRLARRRSSGDVNTITPSNSGGRRPRRKLRAPSNGSTAPGSPHTSQSPHSSRSRLRRVAVVPLTPEKETAEPFSNSDPLLMTPYNVLQDPKYKKSARSYSDLVMIAAESNKSPMISLKKILQEEKSRLAHGKVHDNEGTDEIVRERSRSAGKLRRKSRSKPHPLLKIPFSDGEPSTENSERKKADDLDNSKAVLGVQNFGKSVAKSMKKQAKNTKRRISRQITNAKAATTSRSTPKSHILLDSTAEGSIIDYHNDESDSAFSSKKDQNDDKNNSPLPLKAPSGHRGWGGLAYHEPHSRFSKRNSSSTIDNLRQNDQRMPLKKEDEGKLDSPVPLRPPSGHVKETSPLPLKAPSGHIKINREDFSPLPLKAPSGHIKIIREDVSPLPLKPPSGKMQRNSPMDHSSGSPEEPNSIATEELKQSHRRLQPPPDLPILPEEEGDGKKSRKKRGSKINRMLMRTKKSEIKSTKNIYEQLNSSFGSGLYVNPNAVKSSSVFNPVYCDDDYEENSTSDFTVNKLTDQKGIQFVFYGDPTSRGDNSSSFHKPMNGSFENDDHSVTEKTEPTTSTSSRAITCKQINTPSDRDSSVSTFVSSVVTADNRHFSKNSSEKSYGSPINNTSIAMIPNLMTNSDECQRQSPDTLNTSDEMEVSFKEVAEDKEVITSMDNLLEPSHHNEILAEIDTKDFNIESESVCEKKGSKEKGDDAPSQTGQTTGSNIIGSEASKTKRVSSNQKRSDDSKTEQEIFDLLRNESRKIRKEAKDRKDSSRERAGRHKKESRRLRQRKHIVDMDITVDTDPLEISEISNPHMHIATDRKKPGKTFRSSLSKSDSRGKMKTGDVRKERKSFSRKRASKEVSMAKSAKLAVDAAINER
eukprot:CAMPEP_0197181608 /NCGR_PEP_ID=MMETSP1423-20130617/5846_1 /TAXON_ID=476441 /ORGANISM="Pseudo-nitzschia heimii, Strain UNC1101" /LENGTH=1059 /DNA_ID=CAMNT_0042631895 /DNA_START=62 /DNA_END=3241 /DNA_ORIENTATION=-